MIKIATLGVLLSCTSGDLLSQAKAVNAEFEVASVKPSAPDSTGMFSHFLPSGDVRITGASLKNLISYAYVVRAFQISGGPEWIDTEFFDVEARVTTSNEVTPGEQRKTVERLRNLLADRFQLVLHSDTKEQAIYALIVATGGPKFQESKEGKNLIRKGRGTLKGQSVGMGMLALNLSNEVGRRVIDKSGLAGTYDFELKWSAVPLSADSDEPSLFTALPDQLGLRLKPEKGPVEVLVIDHAERPSKN